MIYWLSKILCRCLRAPFLVINYVCALVSNLNIAILLLLLLGACVGGAAYRQYAKNSDPAYASPNNVFALVREQVDLNAGIDFETSPHCLFCLPGCLVKYFSDLNRRHAALANVKKRQWSDSVCWSISRMFDYGEVLSSMRSGWNMSAVVSVFLFLFTWLIGGGGLVGTIITSMKDFHEGCWRRWSWLLWNHTVILGWNDNVVTIIREHIESQRIHSWLGRWARPERFVVLTSRDVDVVRRRIQAVLQPHKTVLYDVYRGEYDNAGELGRLNLAHSNAVYVIGEEYENSHDARVLMVPHAVGNVSIGWLNPLKVLLLMEKFIKMLVGMSWVIKLELHLESFGLYSQCLRMKELVQSGEVKCLENRVVNIAYRNFCDSWAKRLFANYHAVMCGDVRSCVRLRENNCHRVHLVIIGFSDMGQALAVQAARVAHYETNAMVYVTVYDDDLEHREDEFRALYPRIDEISDIHWTFMRKENIGSEEFMARMTSFAAMDDSLTIAIACDNAADGMKIAIPIYNRVHKNNKTDGDGRVQILLRQDVVGRIMPKNEEAPVLNAETPGIRVFGMKDGAGYNAWFRDATAESLYDAAKIGGDDNSWRDLQAQERLQYQILLDAMEEMSGIKDATRLIKANELLDNGRTGVGGRLHEFFELVRKRTIETKSSNGTRTDGAAAS